MIKDTGVKEKRFHTAKHFIEPCFTTNKSAYGKQTPFSTLSRSETSLFKFILVIYLFNLIVENVEKTRFCVRSVTRSFLL